jgi:hypothetical protein
MNDRKVTLFVSKDGGQNYGTAREQSLGELGQYQQRVRFRRLGRMTNGLCKIRVTSPIVMDHLGAVVDLEVGE